MPDRPGQQEEDEALRDQNRGYVRRLMDLEAERACLVNAAAVRTDEAALKTEQQRRARFREETAAAARMDAARTDAARIDAAKKLQAHELRQIAPELAVLVAVPDGMGGGDVMVVPVPGGREVDVEIPEGLGPGGEFYVGGGKDHPPTKQVTKQKAAGAARSIQAAARGRQTPTGRMPPQSCRRGCAVGASVSTPAA